MKLRIHQKVLSRISFKKKQQIGIVESRTAYGASDVGKAIEFIGVRRVGMENMMTARDEKCDVNRSR